jgi:hypothetical protein
VSENRLGIAQKRVEDKSNEITAMPAVSEWEDMNFEKKQAYLLFARLFYVSLFYHLFCYRRYWGD